MVKKILVMRYRFIGDTILTIPFLRNLRKAYPDAQIDMLAGPVSGDVLLNCPYIDNLIIFDTTKKHRYENKTEKKQCFFSYVKRFRQEKYDKTYVLKRSFSSAALAFLSGIKERIGFDTEKRGFLLTKKVPYAGNKHEIECFLDILRADGIKTDDGHLENWIKPEAEERINLILQEFNAFEKPKVLIHATSGNKKKQWKDEYFAKVIEYLSNEKNAKIFYTGTDSDAETYESILTKTTKINNMPINLCGKLSLKESTALINKMDLVIGVDSGTLHIAASVKTPVIGIYGPMNHIKWKAWGEQNTALYADLPCVPCSLRKKCQDDYKCLKLITPEMVINFINDYLK